METVTIQNKMFYTIKDEENEIRPLGEITGEFKLITELEHFGYTLQLLSDTCGVYLIFK